MKVIVWGTGDIANKYIERSAYHCEDDIIACVDNNKALWGQKFRNYDIISPNDLKQKDFDRLIICTVYCDEVKKQINTELEISNDKVITYFELEEEIKHILISKYKNSLDDDIRKVLAYYACNPLNVYGYYKREDARMHSVIYEVDGTPYIWFESKKMYFPTKHKFVVLDDKEYVVNVLYEQGEHSPHRYIQEEDFTGENMVIVDAGVCEGNFALRYVEAAKKVYLIEPDSEWSEALKKSFEPYKDKVVFCNKFLSDQDSENTIKLDTLVHENIDFLKMDIEGYETAALRGGERVLSESEGRCVICSYHKHNDEINIRKMLRSYGYQIEVSEGYMFFPYDAVLELRRGVVYGRK